MVNKEDPFLQRYEENKDINILDDPIKIKELYIDKKLSSRKIAEIIGSNHTIVLKKLRSYGIQPRSNPEYPMLNDPKWLKEQYLDKRLSANKIAKIVGCTVNAVLKKLRKYKVQIRKVNPVLNDPVRLQELYIDEKKSMKEIEAILDCGHSTLKKSLIRYSIKLRSTEEQHEIYYANDQPIAKQLEDYLIGSLLGDGHLRRAKYLSSFRMISKHLEYLEYVKKLFETDGYKTTIKPHYTCYYLFTLGSDQLMEFRKKWYPNDEMKRIPEDLSLNPSRCLYWYLEDGCLTRAKNKKMLGIVLSTHGFSPEDVKVLYRKLVDILGLKEEGIRITKDNAIRFRKQPALKFLDYIDKTPVICFKYKFDPTIDPS